MIVAERLRRYDTIGVDCVAMNANDVICVGAEPIAMLDFVLTERADAEVCGQLGSAWLAEPSSPGSRSPGARSRRSARSSPATSSAAPASA